MSILNRRNAVLGWSVWQVSKVFAKRKAKQALPGTVESTKRPNKGAMFSVLAAAGGALWFWRRRSRDDESPSTEAPKGEKKNKKKTTKAGS